MLNFLFLSQCYGGFISTAHFYHSVDFKMVRLMPQGFDWSIGIRDQACLVSDAPLHCPNNRNGMSGVVLFWSF
ncbi:hypothetical protein [Candidatus Spongiihabitans sp.]|uniref:hypothetical protein n=1 Tax=Candidatus Spongiihabitans sp. TaxID=3101308 RepID=UPI003C6F4384